MEFEFCLMAKCWLILRGYRPPKSCPRRSDHCSTCQTCGYLELREGTGYVERKLAQIVRGRKLREDINKAARYGLGE